MNDTTTASHSWAEHMYQEGSAACRNYSRLTMHVRTVASVVLMGGAAASVFTHGLANGRTIGLIGLFVWVLTLMLALTNWHFQKAFEAIRDKLAELEHDHAAHGVWCAHQKMRHKENDLISTYGPFVLLGMAGTLLAAFGLARQSGSWAAGLAVAVAMIAFTVGMVMIIDDLGRRAQRKHEQEDQ